MTLVAQTSPYAWPFDGVLEPGRIALIVCGAGAAWAARTPFNEAVDGRIAELRGWAHHVAVSVMLLDEAEPPARGIASLPCAASPQLLASPSESMIPAAGTDGFYGSSLDATLHRAGKTHLLIVGRGFETCVHSTLRRANDRGYECLTVADACASVDPANRSASVSSIEMSGGIFGAVGTTEHVVAAIPTQAPNPRPARARPISEQNHHWET